MRRLMGADRHLRGLALALWAFAAVNALDMALTLWGLAHGDAEVVPAASRIAAAFGARAWSRSRASSSGA